MAKVIEPEELETATAAPGTASGSAGAVRESADKDTNPAPAQWHAPLVEAASYGLAGDIVRTLEPQTEADPVALLIHVLVSMGNLVGRGPHYRVGGANHHTNENAICVGKSSSARKGTAKADTFNLLRHVDPAWAEDRVMGGLSSGEGLIWAVRDQIEKQEPIRGKARAPPLLMPLFARWDTSNPFRRFRSRAEPRKWRPWRPLCAESGTPFLP